MFKRFQAEGEKKPPTYAALKEHILRAHYQAMVWWKADTVEQNLPSPLDYGWKEENDAYVPVIMDKPPAPKAVVELVKCGCATTRCATLACSCRKQGLNCTAICKCEAEDEACDNATNENDELDGSDMVLT